MAVNFATNRTDMSAISKIVDRAWAIDWLRRSYRQKMDMHMDVSAVHANGNPLQLQALLDADDFNFAHDMSGICNCLDRDTGKLTRNFVPRSRAETTMSPTLLINLTLFAATVLNVYAFTSGFIVW